MALSAENLQVKRRRGNRDLAAQRSQTCDVNDAEAKDESVRARQKFDLVAGFGTQRRQDARRESDLSLGSNGQYHLVTALLKMITVRHFSEDGQICHRLA
jgi:hypothetical protein